MPRTEEEYQQHTIVVEEDDDEVAVMIDGEEIELQIDDHGPDTLYTHRDMVYRKFEEPVGIARALIDEGYAP